MTALRIYIAAPLAQAKVADALARWLPSSAYAVVSGWHVLGPAREPHAEDERRRILLGNVADLDRADAVVALLTEGVPRATYAEIGYALAQGKPVVWLTRPGWLRGYDPEEAPTCIFDAHPLVTRVHGHDEMLAALAQIARGLGGPEAA